MSLKVKLGATISAFFLILGLMVMGVFASSTAKIELGGNLSFTATNVHAKVDGVISGAETNPTLKTLTFKEGMTTTEEDEFDEAYETWTNCNLTFKSTGDAVSIVITIQNLADRPLYATISPAITMSTDVESSMLKVSGVDATTGETYNADDLITIDNLDTAYVRLTMTLKNRNATLDSEWGYDISLKDKAGILTKDEWAEKTDGKALYFDLNTEDYTASVKGAGDYDEDEGVIVWKNYGDISVPSHVLGDDGNIYTVTSVAENAFYDVENDSGVYDISSVVLPGTITTIGNYAFCYAEGMTSVNIPRGTTSIGDGAFSSCYRLVEIFNKSEVEITPTSFGLGATRNPDINIYTPSEGNSKLIEIEGYEDYVFFNTGSEYTLVSYTGEETSIILPDNIDFNNDRTNDRYTIRQDAFSGCIELTEMTIPDSITSIGKHAFSGCSGLTSVTIGNGVTSIGNNAFGGCIELTSVTIGNGVTSIGNDAFELCSGLTEITIPDSVEAIGESAFYGCIELTSVTIGNGVTSIGNDAFELCSGLTSVTIPDSVTSIGNNAFSYCSGLKDVYYAGSAEDWAKISIGSNNAYLTDATIHYNSTGPIEE